MNQYFLLLLLSTVVFTTANSQDLRPGYLITVEGDTLAGAIKTVPWDIDPNRISQFVITTADGSTSEWEAKNIQQYQVRSRDEKTNYYAKVWPHNGLRTFLKPRLNGKAQLFVVPDPQALRDLKKNSTRVVFDADFKDPRDDAYYVSSPGTALAIRVEKNNYELVLRQVLKDCPEVTDKIGERKFRFNNLERIIETYNASCGE